MNLGKLVREKMKAMSVDCSGEYIDNSGKHFTMSAAGDGYTISYGGEAKKEIEVSKPQAMKLAEKCRKLESEKDEKKLAASESYKGKTIVATPVDDGFIWNIKGVTSSSESFNNPGSAISAAKKYIDAKLK